MSRKKKIFTIITLSAVLSFSAVLGFNFVHSSGAKTIPEDNKPEKELETVYGSDYIIESKEYKFKTKEEHDKFISDIKKKTKSGDGSIITE